MSFMKQQWKQQNYFFLLWQIHCKIQQCSTFNSHVSLHYMYILALENMNLYHMTKVVQSHLIYEYSSLSAPPILLTGQVSTFYWHLERSRIISANCSLDSFHTITWRACAWQFSNHRKKAFIPVSLQTNQTVQISLQTSFWALLLWQVQVNKWISFGRQA